MPLLLKFHGALGTVTGSCHFFKVKRTGTLCAVDCGAAQGKDAKFQPADPKTFPSSCKLSEICHLLLTHAHGDHMSMLPRWIKDGFTGEIICTHETAELVKVAAEDGLRIAHEQGKDLDIGDEEIRKLLQMLDSGRKCRPLIPLDVEPGLRLVAVPTSHMLGCVGFQLTANNDDGEIRVFFSGDIGPVENAGETRGLASQREFAPEPSDYIISESTYGGKTRESASRSGDQRLRRLSEVLERAFRHGGKSLVFIPAFSLQRSIDVLADVFHVINYRRGTLGLRAGEVPEIIVDSTLARKFAETYRIAYEQSLAGKNSWLNVKSGLLSEATRQGDDKLDTLIKLFPHGKAGVMSVNLTEDDALHEMSIRWGALRGDAAGPRVVICSSGMTNAGSILKYFRNYLRDEATTFVLSGYVPVDSPGDILRTIATLPKEQRLTYSISIPEDKKAQLEAIDITGDEIKSGFATLSEYYSGHADGSSICRYLFSESKERYDAVKRVFLVHGEDEHRSELKELMEHESVRIAQSYPIRVETPDRSSPWFDCGKDEWVAESKMTVIQSMTVPTNMAKDDLSRCVRSVFADARILNLPDDSFIITLRSGAECRSTSKVKISESGQDCLRIYVETRFKGAERLEDVSRTSFRWREVLNAIGADKERHFAGHRWCSTDQEILELKHLTQGILFNGKQRKNGLLLAGSSALSPENRESLEILLTPNTPFYILDDRALLSASRFVFGETEKKLAPTSIFYVPIKCSEEVVEIPRSFDFATIEKLLECVRKDSIISAARNSARENSRVPLPDITQVKADDSTHPAGIQLPQDEDDSTNLAIGKKVHGIVDFVFHHAKNGAFIYALCKLEGRKKAAILHKNQVSLQGFDCMKGDKGDYYIHSISPDGNTVNLSLSAPAATSEHLIRLVADGAPVSCELMADLLQIEMTDLSRYLRSLGISANPNGIMPTGQELGIFTQINNLIELGRSRQRSQPSATISTTCFADIAAELGWDFEAVLCAAEQMLIHPKYAEMAQAIVPTGFIAKPSSAFPGGLRKAFKEACLSDFSGSRSTGNFPSLEAAQLRVPEPSTISLRELSLAWGVPLDELQDRVSRQLLWSRQESVISTQDAQTLLASIKVAK